MPRFADRFARLQAFLVDGDLEASRCELGLLRPSSPGPATAEAKEVLALPLPALVRSGPSSDSCCEASSLRDSDGSTVASQRDRIHDLDDFDLDIPAEAPKSHGPGGDEMLTMRALHEANVRRRRLNIVGALSPVDLKAWQESAVRSTIR